MLKFVEDQLQEGQAPEIWETEEEKGLSLSALKKRCTTLARSRFIRTPPIAVLNKDTNWPIELSNRVINEGRAKFLKTTQDDKNTPASGKSVTLKTSAKSTASHSKLT